MRTIRFILIAILLLACNALQPVPQGTPALEETPAAPRQTETASATLPPSATPTPAPSATLSLPTLEPTASLVGEPFDVRLHPDGFLFVGDRVSFEVIAAPHLELEEADVTVSLADGTEIGAATFDRFGIQGRRQATLRWAWDTGGLAPGDYGVRFQVEPVGTVFTRTVSLLPESLHAFPEPQASWARAESDCCLHYYVTGTSAERDIDLLAEIADQEADLASQQLGVNFQEAITIVYLPRVLGHGGFASGEIYVSYLDRNYAGNNVRQVLHHELVHVLDGRKGGDLRPSVLVEGLAVYLSGGHFKKEPIAPRAAALFDLGWYLPLEELLDDFYFLQHEVSYLEGAALVQYLVNTYGWDAFDSFYRNIRNEPGPGQRESINRALQDYLGLTFDELEAAFADSLQSLPPDPQAQSDIRLTVQFFDTVRRYQQLFDPSAYFLTAWLVRIEEMLETGIAADYVRHPSKPENIALELMLVAADRHLRAGDYGETEAILKAVNAVLTAVEAGEPAPFYADPMAETYLGITLALLEQGFEPQQLVLDGSQAQVQAQAGSTALVELVVDRGTNAWQVSGQ